MLLLLKTARLYFVWMVALHGNTWFQFLEAKLLEAISLRRVFVLLTFDDVGGCPGLLSLQALEPSVE